MSQDLDLDPARPHSCTLIMWSYVELLKQRQRLLIGMTGDSWRRRCWTRYLFGLALLLEQLHPVPPGLVQGVLDGQLPALHPLHDAELHLIAQLEETHRNSAHANANANEFQVWSVLGCCFGRGLE